MDEIAQSLDDWLNEDQIERLSQTLSKIGNQDVSVFLIGMGIKFDLGFVIVWKPEMGISRTNRETSS